MKKHNLQGGEPLADDIEFMVGRAEIRMVPIHEDIWDAYDVDKPYPIVTPGSRFGLRGVAEEFARHFGRETETDCPYIASGASAITNSGRANPFSTHVLLIPYRNYISSPHCPVVGAIGLVPAGENRRFAKKYDHVTYVTWAWLHPYVRVEGNRESADLMRNAWDFIREKWPTAVKGGPFYDLVGTEKDKARQRRALARVIGEHDE